MLEALPCQRRISSVANGSTDRPVPKWSRSKRDFVEPSPLIVGHAAVNCERDPSYHQEKVATDTN